MAVDRYSFLDNYLQNLYKLSLNLDKECLVKISETIINSNNLNTILSSLVLKK